MQPGTPCNILQDLPLYYATSRQNTRYFTLDQDDDSVNPALLYTINKPIVFHDIEAGASCVSALFHNDVREIHQRCSFTLRRQPLTPNILFLANGDVLLTNVSHATHRRRNRGGRGGPGPLTFLFEGAQ